MGAGQTARVGRAEAAQRLRRAVRHNHELLQLWDLLPLYPVMTTVPTVQVDVASVVVVNGLRARDERDSQLPTGVSSGRTWCVRQGSQP